MTHPYSLDIYASSLLRDGRIVSVPEWGCCVLTRSIRDGFEDAMGTYPVAVLDDNADISGGLDRLRALGLVSIVIVVDAFNGPELASLRRAFNFVRPFKKHYLNRPALVQPLYDKRHRYNVRRASRGAEIGVLSLATHLDEWIALYGMLTQHRGLSGIHDLPREHHETLAKLEGVTAIGARVDGDLVGCHIWVHDRQKVLSHLAASSPAGYSRGVAYAIYDESIRHFAGSEVINLGGAAGKVDHSEGGLARFKRLFSNDTSWSYICGKVLLEDEYRSLIQPHSNPDPEASFFPAYRAPPPGRQ